MKNGYTMVPTKESRDGSDESEIKSQANSSIDGQTTVIKSRIMEFLSVKDLNCVLTVSKGFYNAYNQLPIPYRLMHLSWQLEEQLPKYELSKNQEFDDAILNLRGLEQHHGNEA